MSVIPGVPTGEQERMTDLYRRVKRDARDGSISEAIRVHSQACGFVAYVFDVHPDTVAEAVKITYDFVRPS